MTEVLKKTSCPSCKNKGRDLSNDNLVVYKNGGSHCLRATEKVLTRDGLQTIQSILYKNTYILNGEGEWEEVTFKSYGVKQLWKLNLKRGTVYKTIYTTELHQWFLKDSEILYTKDLKPGDTLKSFEGVQRDYKLIDEGLIHGFIYGDGTLHHRKNSSLVPFYTEHKKCLIPIFKSFPKLNSIYEVDIKGIPTKIASVKGNYKVLPDHNTSLDYLYSFLIGYFAADGNLYKSSISISSRDRKNLEFVQDCCIKLGIRTYRIGLHVRKPGKSFLKDKESSLYQLRLATSDLKGEFFLRWGSIKPKRKFDRLNWKVVSVEQTSIEEEVYCCETSTQSFVLEDYIVTHNCFSCGHTVLSDDYKLEHGLLDQVYEHEEEGNTLMFQDKWNQIKNKTRPEGKGFRGIRDDVYAKFGVRHECHTVLQNGEETEELVAQYYPLTTIVEDDTQVCGVKVRQIPKKFRAEGLNKKDKTHLFGQVNFANSLNKTVVIFSGEIDLLSGYQMLFDALGNDQCPAVVSGTCGEGAVEQYSAQYEFLNKFDKIVIVPDADEAGKKALKKAVQALPKDKVYVLEVPQVYKDPNAMLMAGKEKDFVTLYFRAKPYVPDGIVGSGELYQSLIESTKRKKIPLPPFMSQLQDMLNGGFTLESIVNIAAASGLGKSTYVNEILYYMIFNAPYKVGIVSMELSAGQYANALFSRHVQKKLANMPDKLLEEYLHSEEAKTKADELFKNSEGSDRFYIIEDRSSKIDVMKDLIEELVIGCGCKVIVLDPIQDALSGCSLEEQDRFMTWQKVIVKTYEICFINVSHTRKAQNNKESGSLGNIPTEESMQGHSSLYKSASINILLARNKMAESEMDRNTTEVFLSKNRNNGVTGPAGKIFYDNETHTLYNEEQYREIHPELFVEEEPFDPSEVNY